MAARLPRPSKTKKRKKRGYKDKHGWNTLENYTTIYHNCLDEHPFIDHSYPLPEIELYYSEEYHTLYAFIEGQIHCKNDVIVDVRKAFDTREVDGRLQIRCFRYCYNAHLKGKHNIIRYDNSHRLRDYHKHIFDITTGEQIKRISLSHRKFPLFHQVIDELSEMIPNE